MAIEDLLLNIGTNVTGESDLDSLIAKLETLDVLEDTVDPIEIDVDVDGTGKAFAQLRTLEEAVDDIGDVEIDVGGNISNVAKKVADGDATGGSKAATSGGRDDGFQRLNINQLESLREALGDQFDWRSLLREDLTIEEMRAGDGQPIFELPREIDAQDLLFDDRESSGLERLIDDETVEEVIESEGLGGLLSSDSGRREDMIDFPGRGRGTFFEELFSGDGDISDLWRDDRSFREMFFGKSNMRNLLLGDRDGFRGDRSGGLLRPFSGLRMSQFYTALAQLLPLLFVFIAALPAAIASLGALATAALGAAAGLAAVGGLGLLGFAAAQGDGDLAAGMQEITETIREDFLDSFLPLAERFDDLFADGLDGLGELFDAIAARGDTLVQFKDDVRELGGFALDFIPRAIALIVRMGDAFGPVFGMFAEWMNMESDDVLGGLASVFSRSLPHLLRFIDAFIAFLPLLMDLSIGFLFAASYIMEFFGALANLMSMLGPIGTGIGALIGLLIGLATITSMLSILYSTTFVQSIIAAIQGLVSYATATMGATVGTITLLGSLVALTGGLWILFSALGMAASGFGDMAGEIGKAKKSLDQFANARSGFGGMSSGNTSGLEKGSVSVYEDNSTTVYNGSDQENQRREQRRNNYRKKMFSPNQG